jgi:phosphoglycerate dehydrogenase-like enzyme
MATVLIATPLEPELVDRIARVDPRVEVLFEPELLPPTRYPGDHRGVEGFRRAPDDEARFRALMERADVLFGLPGDSAAGLADAVGRSRRLRWVQATAAGAGEQVRAAGLSREELNRVAVTSSAGVHAVPLAEFCLFGLLGFVKELPRLERDRAERRWDHRPVGELHGLTLLVLGLGGIGREIERLARAFGMEVIGLRRRDGGRARLDELLPQADAVCVTLPLTDETRGLLDREAIGLMKPGAIFVNVGRGGVVDEDALAEALADGRLAGAALDVFAREPLPADSPLWTLPNVILSPHTAALSVHENERIAELFCDNLRRYLAGEPLRNRVDPEVFY